MRWTRALWIAGGLAAVPSDPQAQTGGGILEELVPARAGAAACFVRTYDPDHLAHHRAQKVTSMAMMIIYKLRDPPAPDGYWPFAVGVSLRGRPRLVTAGGDCVSPRDGVPVGDRSVHCPIDCDAGAIAISPQGQGQIRVSIPRKDRLIFGDNCDGGGPRTVTLASEPDDHDFVLDRAEPGACRGLRKSLP